MTASRSEATEQQRPVVIGTAGHVDHGKSTLVRALTGIDPDRLAEEKARSMTIDLGFAWFDLPGGRSASIVDVPGHEHFIKNMLAGIGGIDVALLVVAADEGPMPQTREHLAIIDLLGIDHGVVALTKTDLSEPDLVDYVAEEIAELLAATSMAGATIVPVSASSGAGLPDLASALDAAAARSGQTSSGPARLPIDRVFSVAGFGTVVTGTMLGGTFQTGDELAVLPGGSNVRVRGLQSHNQHVERVSGGMRAAINISGPGDQRVRRGDVLTRSGALVSTHRIDVHLRLLADAPATLTQNARVDLFTGATESAAQLTLLESEALEPGQTQLVQMRLASPVAVAAGDRFIVRQASPSATIGGGIVLDPAPRRHRRFDPAVLRRLQGLVNGDPLAMARNAIGERPVRREQIEADLAATVDPSDGASAIQQLLDTGEITGLDRTAEHSARWLISTDAWNRFERAAADAIDQFHLTHPLRPGMPLEELRASFKLDLRQFDVMIGELERSGVLVRDGALLRSPSFVLLFDETTQRRVDRYLGALRERPADPPPPQEFDIDAEVLAALEHQGSVVKLSDAMAFDSDAYTNLATLTLDFLAKHGTISLAEFRDLAGTTRKYAQALLEDFDRRRLTRRVGDVRHRGAANLPKREEQ
ncbi:MAG: selenocysteine-specific translation elongation factor [Thermomicrobiales bacterium]|nr:selenocysteine-specific translation elongation factor [Thermomicrobiales bacterium]